MNVGARVRELRLAKGYSLSRLSKGSGLSMSFLSHLERGEVNASLISLQSVVEALGTDLVELFSQYGPSNVTVMKKEERIALHDQVPGAELAMLTNAIHPVFPCIATLQPEARTSGDPRAHQQGYEFAYALSGRVDYHIDNHVYQLNQGDSLLFDATLNHYCANSSDQPCTWLWVVVDTKARALGDVGVQ